MDSLLCVSLEIVSLGGVEFKWQGMYFKPHQDFELKTSPSFSYDKSEDKTAFQ